MREGRGGGRNLLFLVCWEEMGEGGRCHKGKKGKIKRTGIQTKLTEKREDRIEQP